MLVRLDRETEDTERVTASSDAGRIALTCLSIKALTGWRFFREHLDVKSAWCVSLYKIYGGREKRRGVRGFQPSKVCPGCSLLMSFVGTCDVCVVCLLSRTLRLCARMPRESWNATSERHLRPQAGAPRYKLDEERARFPLLPPPHSSRCPALKVGRRKCPCGWLVGCLVGSLGVLGVLDVCILGLGSREFGGSLRCL
eukprot:9450120-Pyramimonas_sp.AAC.1